MTESNHALNEVAGLLLERQRYEGWLAALEARRESTPAHVFERVHSDYKNRLQQVIDRLAAHRGALNEERANIESRISLLEAEEQMRRDERAELDLRLQVGELTDAEAAEALRALDTTLGELGGEKNTLREKVAAVRVLLDEKATEKPAPQPAPVAAAPAPPPPAPAPAPVVQPVAPPPQAAAAPAPVPQPAPAPAPPRATGAFAPSSHPPEKTGGSFDELAFLSSVVGPGAPGQDARRTPPRSAAQEKLAEAEAAAAHQEAQTKPTNHEAPPAPPAPRRSNERRAEPARDEPLLAEGPESPMSGVRGSGTGVVREPAASEALLSALSARKGEPEGTPLAANVPGNTPIVLRASGAVEHSKTLKCQECGTMNYPTEWYCERCGAELAAL